MKSSVRLLGHQVHPMLIVFPLGLLSTAVIFDFVGMLTAKPTFTLVAYWLIPAGLVGGLVAAVFGLLDWISIPWGTRARTIGLIHGIVNSVVLAVFFAAWMMRSNAQTQPGTASLTLSVVGLLLAMLGGWLGGELVERLGVGVHPGAHVNAPSSLEADSVIDGAADVKGYEAKTNR